MTLDKMMDLLQWLVLVYFGLYLAWWAIYFVCEWIAESMEG